MRDARTYAAEQGVPLEEAVRRLSLQDDLGDLDAELIAKEPGTFAGLWIQHQPDFRVVARFTQGGEQTIQPYVAGGSLDGLVEVLPASANLAQLEAAEAKARYLADRLGIPAESGIDIPNNRAYVNVTDREGFVSALRTANVSLPAEAAVVQVDKLLTPSEDIYGGFRLIPSSLPEDYCTSGFSAVRADGLTGITTAGHCRDSMTFRGTPIYKQDRNSAFSGPYDVQFHTTPDFVDRAMVRDQFGSRFITAGRGRLDEPVDSYVCHFGQGGAEPEYACGYIRDRSYRPTSNEYNSPYDTFVLVRNANADIDDAGDSGGPWYTGGTALGLHSGGNRAGVAYYMSITYFDDDGPQDINLVVRKHE